MTIAFMAILAAAAAAWVLGPLSGAARPAALRICEDGAEVGAAGPAAPPGAGRARSSGSASGSSG